MSSYKTWLEISQSALEHNFRALCGISSPAELIAVVKGNAYGHGLLEVAAVLDRAGATWFGVDWWEDALMLRRQGYGQNLIVLGCIPLTHIRSLVREGISFVVYTKESLREAARASSKKYPAKIHLEIETGFTRQGIGAEDAPFFLRSIRRSPTIALEGLMTHFANVEDVKDQTYARNQLVEFEKVKALIKEYKFDSIKFHTASSAAALLLGESHQDATRTGISLYGLWPSGETKRAMQSLAPRFQLKPALAWKTRIAQVKQVKKGTPVSYGLTERVARDSVVVVIPVGYFDGFDRAAMTTKGHVLIHGQRCKVLGRVCMNMCMVDATDVLRPRVGDEVVLIGKQKNEVISAEELAELAGTINYEIVTRLNPLLPRKIVQ
jgi:alanine racemase